MPSEANIEAYKRPFEKVYQLTRSPQVMCNIEIGELFKVEGLTGYLSRV